MALLSFWTSLRVTPNKIIKHLEGRGESQRDNLSFVAREALHTACVQLRLRAYPNLHSYLDELSELTRRCVDAQAQLIVFPEHVGLFSGSILPGFNKLLKWLMDGQTPETLQEIQLDYDRVLTLAESFQNYIYETYMYTFSTLARLNHVYIAAGSCPFYEEGNIYNRSVLFGPDGGTVGAQGKLAPLGFDSALGVAPQTRIELFDTPLGCLATILGSDAYYFENFKIAAAHGAQIIMTPDFAGGVMRDLLCCRADMAGVYVLYSCVAGPQATPSHAGILAPVDITPKRDGLLAGAQSNGTEIVCARLNLEKLNRVFPECQPNQPFLDGDYIHSYRYCGVFPQQTYIAEEYEQGKDPIFT